MKFDPNDCLSFDEPYCEARDCSECEVYHEEVKNRINEYKENIADGIYSAVDLNCIEAEDDDVNLFPGVNSVKTDETNPNVVIVTTEDGFTFKITVEEA